MANFPCFAAVSLLILLSSGVGQAEEKAKAQPDLSEMLGGFLQGMQSALGNAQAGGGGQQQDPMAGIKNLMESIDPEQIGQFFKNIASPDNLFDWIPAKFRGILPEEWRTKMGEVLVSELDKLAEVWEQLGKHKSGADLWKALQKKTPTLAELLGEIWESALEKWSIFEEGLKPEGKEYVENLKSSFGQWLSQHVLGPFGSLSVESMLNLRESLEKAFPLLEPVVTKAVQSEGLWKWANELAKEKKAEQKQQKTVKGEEGQGEEKEGDKKEKLEL